MELETALKAHYEALVAFARGDPEPVRGLYSRRDDAILANPFGSTAVGWAAVDEALRFASSRFSDGTVDGVETLARFDAPDLVTLFEIERWRSRVGTAPEITPFELRVTTTWRREDGAWRIAQRHADPIRTIDEAGPLRAV